MKASERLRDLAKKSAGHIELIDGREKAMQEELVGREVTLKDFDFLESDGNTFAVFIVDEEPKKYYNGGTSITRLCTDINSDEELVEELRKNGLRLKLVATKTKSKRDFVAIEIL